MSKDIKKALEHCIEWNCADCPNREELGSGETVCRGRLLPEVLEYVADLEAKLAEKDAKIESYKHTVYMNMLNQEMLELKVATQDQAKISFTIDELEKVKSAFGLINSKLDKVETIKEYIHYIDHQINELKGLK